MAGQYWWIIPIFVFIGGILFSYYVENSDNSGNGYFKGVAFVVGVVITTMMTFGIIIGHFI